MSGFWPLNCVLVAPISWSNECVSLWHPCANSCVTAPPTARETLRLLVRVFTAASPVPYVMKTLPRSSLGGYDGDIPITPIQVPDPVSAFIVIWFAIHIQKCERFCTSSLNALWPLLMTDCVLIPLEMDSAARYISMFFRRWCISKTRHVFYSHSY